MNNIKKEAEFIIELARKRNIYPDIPVVTGASSSPKIIIDGREYLTFTSNNYLGLAAHPQIKEACKKNIDTYGMGSAGVRLLSGNLDIHVEFEKQLAKFLHTDDVVTFSSGYLANTGTIRVLTNPFSYYPLLKNPSAGYIFSDELNHTSIVEACVLSKAEKIIYRHVDMADLEAKLKDVPLQEKKLIVTDGVFSMDGDLTPLPDLIMLKKKYNALIMVDDSHGVGVLGEKGAGIAEYFGLQDEVDVIMASFTKAFAGLGGFIGANKTLTDYIRVMARSYIFSDPIPPVIVGGLMEALNIIQESPLLRQKLKENAEYLIARLIKIGFSVKETALPIIPLVIGDEKKIILLSKFLLEEGIFSPPIRYPAVPRGQERLRITLMATHIKEDLDILVESLKKAQDTLNL